MRGQQGGMGGGQGCGCHCSCGGGSHWEGRGRHQEAVSEKGSLEERQRDLEQELADVLDRLNQVRSSAS